MKTRAARFVADVLGDPSRASEIEEETVEDYAERKRIAIENPIGRTYDMPRGKASVADLKDRIRDLEEENQTLNDRLDEIFELAGDEDEDEDSQIPRTAFRALPRE